MTSDDFRPSGSEPAETPGSPYRSDPREQSPYAPTSPSGSTYRASASVPVSPAAEQPPPASAAGVASVTPGSGPAPERRGPYPPSGPLPPRVPQPIPESGAASIPGGSFPGFAPPRPTSPSPDPAQHPTSGESGLYGSAHPTPPTSYLPSDGYGGAPPQAAAGGAYPESPYGEPAGQGSQSYGEPDGHGGSWAQAGEVGGHDGPSSAHSSSPGAPGGPWAPAGQGAGDPWSAEGQGGSVYGGSVYGAQPESGTATLPSDASPPIGQSESPPRGKSRRGLIIGVVAGCVLLLLAIAATGITIVLNRTATTYSVDSCLKRKGQDAVKASCNDTTAYKVVSKVDKKESCPDQNQPFVVLTDSGGKDQVLCLRPAKQ